MGIVDLATMCTCAVHNQPGCNTYQKPLPAVFFFPKFAILATSYRSAEATSRQKCRKSASESAGPKRGAEESAEKVLRPSSLCIAYTEARRPKHFFGTFLDTPFGAGTFRSTFSALLSGRGFGTSVAGRQDCNPKWCSIVSVDVSDIFYFFCSGESEVPGGEGGGRLFMENSQRGGGVLPGRWGGSSGRERVCREFGGVGAKYFFSGPKSPPSSFLQVAARGAPKFAPSGAQQCVALSSSAWCPV